MSIVLFINVLTVESPPPPSPPFIGRMQLALYVLSFLSPRDLTRAAQTCRCGRVLAEDNLLWREKCREAGIDDVRDTLNKRRLRGSAHHHHPTINCSLSTASGSNQVTSIVTPSPWKVFFNFLD